MLLGDQWVGLDPTRILGTEPTHPLFGCTSDFGDGVNPFHVWLKELGIRVGWHDNTVNEGPTSHQWTPPVNLSLFSFSFYFFLSLIFFLSPTGGGRLPRSSSGPPPPAFRHRPRCAAPDGLRPAPRRRPGCPTSSSSRRRGRPGLPPAAAP